MLILQGIPNGLGVQDAPLKRANVQCACLAASE
jgi:hypothetical protein